MVKVSGRPVILHILPPWFTLVMDDDGVLWKRGQMGWARVSDNGR